MWEVNKGWIFFTRGRIYALQTLIFQDLNALMMDLMSHKHIAFHFKRI